jgi:2-oxoglutarate dehydrogenase E1 component
MMKIPIGGDNAYFLDLYSRFLRDETSVPADWVAHFTEIETGHGRSHRPAALVQEFLAATRWLGHLEAELDPLSRNGHSEPQLTRLREALAPHGRDQINLKIGGVERGLRVAEASSLIRSIYSGPIGLEVAHLDREEEREWWHSAFEAAMISEPDDEMVGDTLDSIILADEFESFMRVKFPTKKRFGSEGSEGSLVFVRDLLKAASGQGIGDVVLGGMHRGRLALLAVALGKSPATLAAELMGRDLSEGATFTGDVPYHLGYRAELNFQERKLGLTLLPHPSHLLVVAPVALGLSRAMARRSSIDHETMCVLMHTDAAFSGQGLTSELLQLSELKGYTTGGTIHVVVNNQIGFTTLPSEGRTARYCTDAAKLIGAPVLHVNGDAPVAVARAARLALAWRQRFHKDVLIDLVCYRRYGHNELDEPRFTQPGMWSRIDLHPPLREHFSKSVLATRPHLKARTEAVAADFRERLRAGFEISAEISPNDEPVQSPDWAGLQAADEAALLRSVPTGVPLEELRRTGLSVSTLPEGLEAHPKVRRFYELRAETISSGEGINFATAEALAFATLLAEGVLVRLSGQDAVRGTFTQRHMAVHDVSNQRSFIPLEQITQRPATFESINSPLSEYGVLGFEYGHSLCDSRQLTLWEAQFGDFINGAQVVVDQYIVSAEAKWRLRSGLVVLLPHGLEGQGPDHSSARIERLTQLCAGGNILIANPSTPANLFHLLRRQIHAPWRKPLFVIAPKSLLRAKAAISALAEMEAGTAFRPIIAETAPDPAKVRRIVMCSGKVFYALNQARKAAGLETDILPVRIEQIYPLSADDLAEVLAPFPGAELVWLQEEAENQGAWPYLSAEFARAGIRLSPHRPVIARPALSVTAGGSVERHEREEGTLIEAALTLPKRGTALIT